MEPTDMFIHVATHLAVNHQFSLQPLRSLIDLALLIEHRSPDWKILVERAARWQLRPVLWRTLSALQEIWLSAVPADVLQELAPRPLQRQLLSRLISTKLLLEEKDQTTSSWRYLILLALIERPSDRRQLIKTALWPPQSDLPEGKNGRLRRLWQLLITREL
jgi:hypothetical protein